MKNGLLKYSDERRSQIEGADIKKFKEQSKKLTKALNNASWDIEDKYEDSIEEITSSLEKELREKLKDAEKEFEDTSTEVEGTDEKVEPREGLFPRVS